MEILQSNRLQYWQHDVRRFEYLVNEIVEISTQEKKRLFYHLTGYPLDFLTLPFSIRHLPSIFQFKGGDLYFQMKRFTLKNIRCMCESGWKTFPWKTSECNIAFFIACYLETFDKEPTYEIVSHLTKICEEQSNHTFADASYRFYTPRILVQGFMSDYDKTTRFQPLTLQTQAFELLHYYISKRTGVLCYFKSEQILVHTIHNEYFKN